MRIKIDNQQSTAAWVRGIDQKSAAVPEAAYQAGVIVANEIETAGRTDIAQAGRFGLAWTQGFNAKVTKSKDGVKVTATMRGPRWRIFQEGRTIFGKPLLWIPFSREDSKGIPQSRYPGGLVETRARNGLPLLVSVRDHRPKYFGKESVTIPKKFHLIEITQAVGSTIDEKFAIAYRGLTHG